MLLPDTVLPEDLRDSERREACRSLKGAVLRREIYGLDGKPESSRPYSVSESNYGIKALQHQETNRHSVFFTHPLETIDFHYERKVYPVAGGRVVNASQNPTAPLKADPRISHAANLAVDDYGNVLQSVAVSYGRRFDDSDPVLSSADRNKQKQLSIIFTEASFTNAVLAADAYRTPLSAEMVTFQVVNVRSSFRPGGGTPLLRLDELAEDIAKAGDGAHDLPYEDVNATGAAGPGPYRRLIGRKRILYRSNRLTQFLPLSELEALAIAGESYRLAFTSGLLGSVYAQRLPDPAHARDRGGYVDLDGDGNWWTRSGRVFYHPGAHSSAAAELDEAVGHFFLARRFRDPFGQQTTVEYASDLLPAKITDALGNTNEARYDFRTLQPHRLTDPNGNRSSVLFDTLGLAAASAVAGKVSEAVGDSLDGFSGFDVDPALGQLQGFVANPKTAASALLKSATSRFVNDLDRFRRCGEPPFAATLVRETHANDPVPQGLKIQISFTYSDGFGRELQTKIQAEPGAAAIRGASVPIGADDLRPGALTLDADGLPALGNFNSRWVGKGRRVYNNKGNAVKQYEPFFSSTHLYEPEPEMTDTGVTPLIIYDPADRVVAVLHPNHTYEKTVFDPWKQEVWDANDNVLLNPASDPDIGSSVHKIPEDHYLPTWYQQRQAGQMGAVEQESARKAAFHANTPGVSFSDPQGRAFSVVQHNRFRRDDAAVDEYYATRTDLDILGNQRSVTDALGRVIMTNDYDLLKRTIHQNSADSGERWMVPEVAGNPILAFDGLEHRLRYEYDQLRRPTALYVRNGTNAEKLTERSEFGESQADAESHNLRGKPYLQFDQAGVVRTPEYDFKGNLLRSSRQMLAEYRTQVDWAAAPALEPEVYVSETSYDALNRPTSLTAPDRSAVRPAYNDAGLLDKLDVSLKGPDAFTPFVTNIDYNAKGQRELIEYGNGARTASTYDPLTFRLTRIETTRSTDAARLQDLSYVYDPAGNVSQVSDLAQQTVYFKNQVVSANSGYLYDATYRLIQADGREQAGSVEHPQTPYNDFDSIHLPLPGDGQAMRHYRERYQYDAVGNILELLHSAGGDGTWRRQYEYAEIGSNNRLTKTTLGQTEDCYSYDANGNMLRMPHLPSLSWDFKNQLSSAQTQVVSGGSPGTTYYAYDSGGQRARKVTVDSSGNRRSDRVYIGAGFELYRQYTPGGQVSSERSTLHVMDDKRRVALVETRGGETTVRYQFDNNVRSACLELDDEGAVITYEEFYPYGSTSYQAGRSSAEVGLKRYRFTGKERDDETGFSYHGARYYAPWLGRWTSCDPAGMVDGTNLYHFVRNNPLLYADPTGTQCDPTNSCCVDPTVSMEQDQIDSFGTTPSPGEGAVASTLGAAAMSSSPMVQPAANSIEDLLTFLHAQAGFETGAVRPPTFNPRSASPFGTAAHARATAVLDDMKAIGMSGADRIYSEVRVVNGTITQIGGTPGGPAGSHNIDIMVAREGQTLTVGQSVSGGVAEGIGDLKYGGGTIDPKYSVHGSPLQTINGRTQPGVIPEPPPTAPSSGFGTVLKTGGTVLAVGGTVFSAYSFSQDVSEGNWGSAALNGTGFAGGALTLGGSAVGSTSLVGAGTVIGAPAAVVGAGVVGWKIGTYTNENTAISDVAAAGGSAVERLTGSTTLGAVGAAATAVVTAPVFVPIAIGKGIGRGASWLWNKIF
jgi:RHS repeat-associated protein